MLNVLRDWVERYFSDEEAVVLFILLLAGLCFVLFWGDIMAPAIASIIVAFVLQGIISYLIARGMPRRVAIYLAYCLFVGAVLALVIWLLPLVSRQVFALIKEAPAIIRDLQEYLYAFQAEYPTVISIASIDQLYQQIMADITTMGQWLVSQSLASVPVLITALIYFVVVPLLVFFFLKDKDVILAALGSMLPLNRRVMTQVWVEINIQFANYVRGKVVEIIVVGGTTYMAFIFMDLNYALLLAVLVGLSVVIPYIGAVVVTIPVTMIALFQFGLTEPFYYVMAAYLIIQALDGNILVPLLFSEVNNLHPVVIILSVLFFGGIWGVWGVFFAIPLATLVKAVFNAWPSRVRQIEPAAPAIHES